ncbi:hypothetical protein U1872_01710 [Sphingomonas sp. RB3P16]|uniref:hypothetical protein n=1 Tax=Parasphingomonas frigoris TaxID=3096163 RepID=UPI002FCA942E
MIWFVAFACRALQFGNPVIQIDEQFYLLAGDRLLHGALPFVDIWDRKPFGLFALYAAIRALGGSGILQYQIVATLFAAATATAIAQIALRLSGPRGATIAGLVYLLFILSSGGDGGQAPVFYNLPVALAALAVLKLQECTTIDRRAVGWGCLAMALVGVAVQIKYTVLFEGLFFGLCLLVLAWRRGARLVPVALLALLWCAIALLPTALVLGFYWQRGVLDQLVFANFLSVFQRSPHGLNLPARILRIALHIALPAVVAGWAMRVRSPNRPAQWLVCAWLLAALAGVAVFGTYHAHYALPLFVPLAAAGAPLYGNRAAGLRLGRRHLSLGALVLLVGGVLGLATMIGTRHSRGTGAAVYAAAQRVGTAPLGCIFVFSGDPILYHLTNSCLPTAFLFPTFLSETQDSVSLGIDPIAELQRILRARPAYIFTHERPPVEALPQAWAIMRGTLRRDYHLVFRHRAGTSVVLGYQRN